MSGCGGGEGAWKLAVLDGGVHAEEMVGMSICAWVHVVQGG